MSTHAPSTHHPAEGVHSRLRQWYRRVPGRLVLRAERSQLDALLPSLSGDRIVQVGCVGHPALLSSSSMPHRIVLDTDVDASDIDPHLYARADALPFQTESLDVLVLPHTLEFARDPQGVLQESDRVLVPEGHLIIIGFNPWGLWGIWRWLRRQRDEVPWCGHFLGLSQLRKWMIPLGFRIIRTRHFFFRPPSQQENLLRMLSWLEGLGRWRFFPVGGALYLVVAQKRVTTLTPVRLRWKEAPRPRVTGLCWVENDTKS